MARIIATCLCFIRALVDSMVGRELLSSFARLSDVDVLVTDRDVDVRTVAALEQTGIEVVIA